MIKAIHYSKKDDKDIIKERVVRIPNNPLFICYIKTNIIENICNVVLKLKFDITLHFAKVMVYCVQQTSKEDKLEYLLNIEIFKYSDLVNNIGQIPFISNFKNMVWLLSEIDTIENIKINTTNYKECQCNGKEENTKEHQTHYNFLYSAINEVYELVLFKCHLTCTKYEEYITYMKVKTNNIVTYPFMMNLQRIYLDGTKYCRLKPIGLDDMIECIDTITDNTRFDYAFLSNDTPEYIHYQKEIKKQDHDSKCERI